MNYKEAGFRAFYQQFTVFMLNDKLRIAIARFPHHEEAEAILTYGYIDRQRGLTLEILAVGVKKGRGFRFFEGNNQVRSFIRIDLVEEEEFFYYGNGSEELISAYREKLDMVHDYDVSKEIEETRNMESLDQYRDEYCIDDVMVFLLKDGLRPEGCWVRINDYASQRFQGTLLNEPNQDFGCYLNDEIGFSIGKTGDGETICYCDLSQK